MNRRWGLLVLAGVLAWPGLVTAQSGFVVRTISAHGVQIERLSHPVSAGPRQVVGPERQYHALFTPDDPQYPLQWNLGLMNIPGAWDIGGPFFGSSSVVVAILDTGVAYTTAGGHQQAPDLASTLIWTNAGEIAGDGLDNDGNSKVDDINGWNYVSNNNIPADDHGHGTHLAALVGAGTNNALAAAGIAPGVTIMPIKVLDSAGNGSTSTIAAGVEYAVAKGADIINLSLGGTEPDAVLAASITNAVNQGVLVVAAAGNDGDGVLNYPAHYSNTLSVGGTQYDGTRAPYSNYGSDLDLAAPGGNVSLDQNGDGQPDGILEQTCDTNSSCQSFGLYFYSGTSQATAQVSAVAALVLSCPSFTGDLTSTLINTATDLGPAGRDDATGAGLVNAQAALASVGCSSGIPLAPSQLQVRARASTAALAPSLSWPYAKPYFSWSGAAGLQYRLTWGKYGQAGVTTTQSATSFQPTISKSGLYQLKVTAIDGDADESSTAVILYRYRPSQLLVSSPTGITVLNNKGAAVRSIGYSGNGSAPFMTGGTITVSGEDRYLAGGRGRINFYKTSGQATSTLRPFGQTSTLTLGIGVLRRAGDSALYAVGLAAGSEARVINNKALTLKRLILGSGKLRGVNIATGDIDTDGQDEFVAADKQGSLIRLYRNNGALVKSIRPLGSGYAGGWAVAMGDVTADGKADIVAIANDARKSPAIFVLSPTGTIVRTARLSQLTATASFQLTVADLDGNGRDEIIVFAPGKAQLTTWTERGTKLSTIALTGDTTLRRLGSLR